MPLRVGFVLVLGAIGLAASYVLSPSIRRAVARWPERTALGAGGLALACELANHLVLPRLYPAFHFGLAALTAMTAPFLGRGLAALVQGDSAPRREAGRSLRPRSW